MLQAAEKGDRDAINAMPGGDNTLLNQVILQSPEVAQDSFGQFHIRGEHNGLQYRVNGIILPEGISAFGQSLESAQFNFSADDLNYIATHYIDLDHEQRVTGSAGASYLWRDTRFGADLLFASGLRASQTLPNGSVIPNGTHLPYYTQVNTGISHVFHIPGAGTLTARADVTNLFDREYQIRNGTGVGVFAPQYGPRRGYFFGLSKSL
jgi:hypothetical protein